MLKKTVEYIERCRIEDGGYVFSRIPPSSTLDTYFAVQSLSILGIKPHNPNAVADFLMNNIRENSSYGLTCLFTTIETLNEIGYLPDNFREYAYPRIMDFRNEAGGFGSYINIDVENPSELKDTYRAVKSLITINADFNKSEIISFISKWLNADGGYGSNGFSTLASTFFAMETYRLMKIKPDNLDITRQYLIKRGKQWQIQFIEDIYWLISGLNYSAEQINFADTIIQFVKECQRYNGGYSRATAMGIPTLEYTFYALSILKQLGYIDNIRLDESRTIKKIPDL